MRYEGVRAAGIVWTIGTVMLFAAGTSESAQGWRDGLDFPATEARLKADEDHITESVPLHEWLQRTGKKLRGQSRIRVIVIDGVRAVFKPTDDPRLVHAEVDAYELSQHLGLELVPPTVGRTLWGTYGKLQYYVESPFDLKSSSQRAELAGKVSERDWSNNAIFTYLICNADANFGNFILDAAFQIAQIDNDKITQLCHRRWDERPWVLRNPTARFKRAYHGEPFPYGWAKLLEEPTLDELREAFRPYMTEDGITWHHDTWRRFNDNRAPYVIWRGGVWIQWRRRALASLSVPVFPRSTLEALARLEFQTLRLIFDADAFSEEHLLTMLERRDQILEAARE